jgi:CelD/BcsL family acetyltransferase involved in cellulose biosynthesis
MEIVQQLDESVWREFVGSHPQAQIFHTPEMFEVFACADGHQPVLWAATEGHTRVLALLPAVEVTLKDGLWRSFTTRAIAYGSVLCEPGAEGEVALAQLLQSYARAARKRALFTELRNLSDLTPAQPVVQNCGFAYEDHLNYLVNLDLSPEEVMQNIGRRTRKNLRRALKQGDVVIEEASRLEQAEVCYRLLRTTYAAVQVPLAGWSLFQAAFNVLYPRGMVKFLLARVGEEYAAGSVELVFKDKIYGWYGGMDRNYSEFIPNEVLLWHLFEWGAQNGCKVYDFGGAGKPDEDYGVRDFKAKFGGQLVCYGRNTLVHSRARLAISKGGYQLYRYLKRMRHE